MEAMGPAMPLPCRVPAPGNETPAPEEKHRGETRQAEWASRGMLPPHQACPVAAGDASSVRYGVPLITLLCGSQIGSCLADRLADFAARCLSLFSCWFAPKVSPIDGHHGQCSLDTA